MEKQLPYIGEDGLHYEAYWSVGGVSYLREGLPVNHEENIFNYLERHGINGELYFEKERNVVPIKK